MVLYDPARRPRAKPIFTPSTRNMNAIAYRWTREGNLVIPDPVKLERKLPLYFRHQHYSSFQRQLNNFGFNKQHKSASPLNSVYVRIKGEQLADVDVVELLHLRPVLE